MNLADLIPALFRRAKPPTSRSVSAPALTGDFNTLSSRLSVPVLASIIEEAKSGNTERLFTLYGEIISSHAHTQSAWNQRKLAVLNKALTALPADEANPADVRAAQICNRHLCSSPGWSTILLNSLLDGHLYPVSVVNWCVRPAPANSGLRWIPGTLEDDAPAWLPVQARLLDYQTGQLRIFDCDPVHGHRLTSTQQPEGRGWIVHRGHLLTTLPDTYGGPLRAVLFWYLFAVMDRDWWVQFLARFGAPFLVGKYEDGRDTDRRLLQSAFSAATRLFGLVITKDTDVQVQSVSTNSHGEAFEKLQTFANGEISKLILGQTMTATAQAGGLGGAQAQVQESTRADIEAWDITALAETINNQLFAPFLELNGIPGRAVLQLPTATGDDLQNQAAFLKAAAESGLQPTDEGIKTLSKTSGIPLERRAALPAPIAPASPFSLEALSILGGSLNARLRAAGQPTNEDLARIDAAAAPDLARAFIGRYAPIRRLIEESPDEATLRRALAGFSATLSDSEATRLLEEALFAHAANGTATARP